MGRRAQGRGPLCAAAKRRLLCGHVIFFRQDDGMKVSTRGPSRRSATRQQATSARFEIYGLGEYCLLAICVQVIFFGVHTWKKGYLCQNRERPRAQHGRHTTTMERGIQTSERVKGHKGMDLASFFFFPSRRHPPEPRLAGWWSLTHTVGAVTIMVFLFLLFPHLITQTSALGIVDTLAEE